jgi:hypothetical protein
MLLLAGELANMLHINRQQLRSREKLHVLIGKQSKKRSELLQDASPTSTKRRCRHIAEQWL